MTTETIAQQAFRYNTMIVAMTAQRALIATMVAEIQSPAQAGQVNPAPPANTYTVPLQNPSLTLTDGVDPRITVLPFFFSQEEYNAIGSLPQYFTLAGYMAQLLDMLTARIDYYQSLLNDLLTPAQPPVMPFQSLVFSGSYNSTNNTTQGAVYLVFAEPTPHDVDIVIDYRLPNTSDWLSWQPASLLNAGSDTLNSQSNVPGNQAGLYFRARILQTDGTTPITDWQEFGFYSQQGTTSAQPIINYIELFISYNSDIDQTRLQTGIGFTGVFANDVTIESGWQNPADNSGTFTDLGSFTLTANTDYLNVIPMLPGTITGSYALRFRIVDTVGGYTSPWTTNRFDGTAS